jgi:hypothetical protein
LSQGWRWLLANVLLVMADQMTQFMLEACGHPITKTANLNALAAQALNFANAYSPGPICVPAWSCPITGQTSIRPLDGRSMMAAISEEALAKIPVISEHHGKGKMRPGFMVCKGKRDRLPQNRW